VSSSRKKLRRIVSSEPKPQCRRFGVEVAEMAWWIDDVP